MPDPNFLLVSIDSLRADFCSFLNPAEETMPNLEKLAEDSAIFPQAVSPSVWTLQSHASMLSGLYPPEHQLRGQSQVSLGDHPTFAQKLSEAGYETHSFGYNGWLETSQILRGFTHHSSPTIRSDSTLLNQVRNRISRLTFQHQWRDENTIESAISQLEELQPPFCCFVHLNGTHHKYSPPSPYHQKFGDRSTVSLAYNLFQQKKIYNNRAAIYSRDFWPNEKTITTIQDLYRGCISYVDTLLQRLIQSVPLSERENTVIMIFSDHGDNFGEDGVFGHQFSVADSLIRIPLLIKDPTGSITQGRHSEIVQLNDLYPTILELAECAVPETNSQSILSSKTRKTSFTYYTAPAPFINRIQDQDSEASLPPTRQYAAWQSPDDKVVFYPDRGEYKKTSQQTPKLRSRLKSHMSKLQPVEPRTGNTVSQDVIENLEDMGYM